MGIEKLERRHVLTIMLYLYQHKPRVLYTDLRKAFQGSEAILQESLDLLKEDNLIEEHTNRDRIIVLTRKGLKIAEKIEEINEIMETL